MSWLRCVLCFLLALTALVSSAQPHTRAPVAAPLPTGRDIGIGAPWVSYYGNVAHLDLARVASTFRLIDIDADPDQGNVTPAQIATLKADGTNRVISYLNLGACERFRSYWQHAPAGFLPCGRDRRAHLGRYDGYRDETWMNPSDPAYRKLIVSYVAPRLIAQGVDGFYLDNLELIEHGVRTRNGPCDATCQQGALDLVRELRNAFPDKILVMQNATGPASSPERTRAFTASASAVRSPCPSQAMRAGRPSNGTYCRASRIQLVTILLSGNISSTRSSIRAMSDASPDSAIQRNGPMARANSGRR